jgi:hypothetical protein
MPESPFVDLLLRLSALRLGEMLTQTDERIRKLQFEREYIAQALAEKQGGHHASERQVVPRTERPLPKARRKSVDRRNVIRQIMLTKGETVWIPSAIRDQLADQGVEITTPAVRATMKRMLEDGELERPGEGDHGFKLASRNGSSRESNTGPTENETGETLSTAPGSHSET